MKCPKISEYRTHSTNKFQVLRPKQAINNIDITKLKNTSLKLLEIIDEGREKRSKQETDPDLKETTQKYGLVNQISEEIPEINKMRNIIVIKYIFNICLINNIKAF